MSQAPKAPEGHEILTDVNEKVQAGDLVWIEEDREWQPAGRFEIGLYVHSFIDVVRPLPALKTTTTKRIMRSKARK